MIEGSIKPQGTLAYQFTEKECSVKTYQDLVVIKAKNIMDNFE